MEATVLEPQQAVSPPAAAPARKAPGSTPKPKCTAAAARRKTLGDITNLRRRAPDDEPACAAADGAEAGVAQLVKENADLVKLLEERDEIIQLGGTEIEKLRLANWELARTNSLMMALKALQHELACSRAALRAKTSELEEAKKAMKLRERQQQQQQKMANGTAHNLGPERAAQIKNGGVVNPEPSSDASHASSANRPGNASRKRMLRSRSLGPGASLKLAAPKDMETTQRRKSMRTPHPRDRREDLFELEDVQLAIGSCKIDPESASGSERPGHQFLRRSSLGRPLRQARERVATYKEMPLNIKLRRS